MVISYGLYTVDHRMFSSCAATVLLPWMLALLGHACALFCVWGFKPPESTRFLIAGDGEGDGVPNGDSTYVMTKEHAAAFKKVLL